MSLVERSRVPLSETIGGAPSDARNLGLDIEAQQQTQWCWAAVAVSVATFYEPGSAWTQCGLAQAEFRSSDCCARPGPCNAPWYLDRALERVGHLEGETLGRALAFEDLCAEIDRGRPVGVRIQWRGGGGHFVVIDGYDAADDLVDVKDPWEDGHILLAYRALRDRYEGTGTWSHSYRTRG